ncbi:MAG: hypothetical protein AAFX50_26735, partial [Acidobacteriota bacterium]
GWLARRAAEAFGLSQRVGLALRGGDRDALRRAADRHDVRPLVLPAPGSPGLWLEAAARPGD